MSGVSVYYGNELVRNYVFNYSQDRNPRLTTVRLKDEDGDEITRTTINWGEDRVSADYTAITGLTGQDG